MTRKTSPEDLNNVVQESVHAGSCLPEDHGDFIVLGTTVYGGKNEPGPAGSLAELLATGALAQLGAHPPVSEHSPASAPPSAVEPPAGPAASVLSAQAGATPPVQSSDAVLLPTDSAEIATAGDVVAAVRRVSSLLAGLAPMPLAPRASGTIDAEALPLPGGDRRDEGNPAPARLNPVLGLDPAPAQSSPAAARLSPVLAAEGKQAVDLLRLLVRVGNQVEGYAALVASVLAESGLHTQFGARDCVGFLTDHLDLPYGQARRLSELGDGLRTHLPQTAADLCSGLISAQNAKDLVDAMTASPDRIDYLTSPAPGSNAPAAGNDGADGADGSGTCDVDDDGASGVELVHPDDASPRSPGDQDEAASKDWAGGDPNPDVHPAGLVLTGEQALLGRVAGQKPKIFRSIVQGLAQRVDPTAGARDYTNLHASQRLEILADRKGGYTIRGQLDDEAGLMLKTVLKALRAQLPKQTRRTTSIEHQNALALYTLTRLDLEQVLHTTKNGSQLHLMVSMDLDTFTTAALNAGLPAGQIPAGAGLEPARWVDTRGPIPDALLERMACDSKVSRMIFGPASQVLNAGDEIRIATAAQRRAVMLRDTHCIFPECTAPPGICDIHHLDEWANDGGPTNIDNLALLCWNHHHHIHDYHLKLTRTNGHQWQILRRDTGTQYPPRC